MKAIKSQIEDINSNHAATLMLCEFCISIIIQKAILCICETVSHFRSRTCLHKTSTFHPTIGYYHTEYRTSTSTLKRRKKVTFPSLSMSKRDKRLFLEIHHSTILTPKPGLLLVSSYISHHLQFSTLVTVNNPFHPPTKAKISTNADTDFFFVHRLNYSINSSEWKAQKRCLILVSFQPGCFKSDSRSLLVFFSFSLFPTLGNSKQTDIKYGQP